MIRGLYTAVNAMVTLEAKQDVITNNMANANTNGYKAEDLKVKKFQDVLIQNKDKVVGGQNVKNTIGSLSLGAKIDGTDVEFTQGTLSSTDNDTDMAIDGRGFFSVKRGDKTYFTRDGQFRINTAGYLVTSEGDSVMGRNIKTGASEPIYVGNGKLTVDNSNNVIVNNVPQYKMQVADFNDYKNLKKLGDNLYESSETPNYNGQVYVKQKTLEKSNVNIVNEMVNMMTVMRSFETTQKVVQTMDETLSKAANEIGSVR
ncbi:flagellar hook-basal body complex protein [Clostridium fungisolvens]|uniref:Flagellar basal-body rod protein FlgG n=1 Tax=Clostridium fungisolvens TaxID=1604897 RepID=A0A6V8SQB4_9CLOT|nr:flagellar hook-basal body complex protein [Clostridium fungisolvens]GFP77073.1 Flagellar basal-body rod protein FlgG [Clostridium fungisolvens]